MKKKIIIWGSAGHGSAVLDLSDNVGFKLETFLDESIKSKKINNKKLIKGKKNIFVFFKKKTAKKYSYKLQLDRVR